MTASSLWAIVGIVAAAVALLAGLFVAGMLWMLNHPIE